MSDILVLNDGRTHVRVTVLRDADWLDPLPRLVEADGASVTPIDLTTKRLELWIRPTYDHDTLIRKLWSNPDEPDDASGGIIINGQDADPVQHGYASLYLPRSEVIATLPIGTWQHFLLLVDLGETTGYREIWRGPFLVQPGKVTGG